MLLPFPSITKKVLFNFFFFLSIFSNIHIHVAKVLLQLHFKSNQINSIQFNFLLQFLTLFSFSPSIFISHIHFSEFNYFTISIYFIFGSTPLSTSEFTISGLYWGFIELGICKIYVIICLTLKVLIFILFQTQLPVWIRSG